MMRDCLALALLAGASTASAQTGAAVSSERLACERGVHLVSDGAGLHEVLGRLSRTLDFEVRYWTADNPAIRIDTRQRPLDLMRELSTHANVLARYRPDLRCPGQLTIDAVWVLPAGKAQAALPPLPPPPAPAAPAAPARGAAASVATAQEQYLRAHGMLPPATASSEARH